MSSALTLFTLGAVACSDDPAPADAGSTADTGAVPEADSDASDSDASDDPQDAGKSTKPANARAFKPGAGGKLVGGPHAALGDHEDDVVLDNGLVRFVIRGGPTGVSMYGTAGGQLVDAARIIKAPGAAAQAAPAQFDHLRELVFTLDAHQVRPDKVEILANGGDGGAASVRVSGPMVPMPALKEALNLAAPDIEAHHTYTLEPGSSVLEIRTHLRAKGKGAASVMAVDVAAWSGEQSLWLPGYGADDLPTATATQTLGFALRRVAGTTAPMRVEHAISTPGKFIMIDAGAFRAFMHANVKATAEGMDIVRHLAVGGPEKSDLAAAMAAAREASGAVTSHAVITGKIDDAFEGAAALAMDSKGKPITRCLPDDKGAFACPLPANAKTLRGAWIGDGGVEAGGAGQDDPKTDIPVPADKAASLAAPRFATLNISALDSSASMMGLPVRVTLVPLKADGKPGGDKVRARVFAEAAGEGTHKVPAGTYHVYVHHGPFYTQHKQLVALKAGETVGVTAKLRRVVDTGSWVSADLHVHAEASPDSHVITARRLTGAAAEGIRYLVASDHDHVTDYADFTAFDPTVTPGACGSDGNKGVWAHAIGKSSGPHPSATVWTVSGMELTTMKAGHFNAWPAKQVAWYEAPISTLLDLLGVGDGGRTVMCNHPRDDNFSYWDAIDFDPEKTDVKLLRCQLIEVLNGFDPSHNEAVFKDWMALLDRGLHITATGASDSHYTDKLIGNPRTLVRLPAAKPSPCTSEPFSLDKAMREGRAIASAGPLLQGAVFGGASPDPSALIGDELTASPAAELVYRARINAPDWIPLGRVELWLNGERVVAKDISATKAVKNARSTFIDLPLPATDTDQFVVAVHIPKPGQTASPGLRVPAWAIANPIRIKRKKP